MSIRKFRASRVNTTTGNIYVGQYGDMFYDEGVGLLKISDGRTPGGHYVSVLPATPTMVGGIKAGPGANVATDGTLTINTAGLNLSFGDFTASAGNLYIVNPNEDMNILTNGTGNINLVGNLRIQTTSAGPYYTTPILSADNHGNVTVNGNLTTIGNTYYIGTSTFIGPIVSVGSRTSQGDSTFNGNVITNGNLITNGNTILNGPVYFIGATSHAGNVTTNGNLIVNGSTYLNGYVSFIGPTVHQGNLTTNGNLITNGSSYFVGDVNEIGNLTVTGNAVNNGNTIFNGSSIFNGNTIRTGTTISYGNVTWNGNTFTNGNAINNGNTVFNGNILVTGETTFIVTMNSNNQGALEITGNAQGLSQPPQNSGVMLHTTGPDGDTTAGRAYFDSSGNYTVIAGRRYNGTIANPTQVLANQDIVRWGGTPYGSSGWPTIGPVRISYTVNEDQSATNQGGRIEFWTTANGTVANTSISRTATIDPALGVTSNIGFVTGGNVTAGNVIATTYYGNVVGSTTTLSGNVIAGNVNISTNGTVSLAAGTATTAPLSFASGTLLTTTVAGATGYDGTALYFTPLGTQRGIVPAEQVYVLGNAYTYSQSTTNQGNLFPLVNGVTLSSSTRYKFEIMAQVSSNGANNASLNLAFAGTAGLLRVSYNFATNDQAGAGGGNEVYYNTVTSSFATGVAITNNNQKGGYAMLVNGIVDVQTGGSFNPTIGFSAIPTTVTVNPHAYMRIYPIGNITGNTVVGTWN